MKTEYRCRMIRAKILDEDHLFDAGLPARLDLCPDSSTPFALCYHLFIAHDAQVFADPAGLGFVMNDGAAEVALALNEPWIAETYGRVLFDFLGNYDLRVMAADMLREMIPRSQGYTFALCADGLLLVAGDPSRVVDHHGEGAVAAAFRPRSLSNHDALSKEANLLACARAIIAKPRAPASLSVLTCSESEQDMPSVAGCRAS